MIRNNYNRNKKNDEFIKRLVKKSAVVLACTVSISGIFNGCSIKKKYSRNDNTSITYNLNNDENIKDYDVTKYIDRLLKKGDTGEDVKVLQERLDYLGLDVLDNKGNISGYFGNKTEAATRAVQQFAIDGNLIGFDANTSVDGIVGSGTWEVINILTETMDSDILSDDEKLRLIQEKLKKYEIQIINSQKLIAQKQQDVNNKKKYEQELKEEYQEYLQSNSEDELAASQNQTSWDFDKVFIKGGNEKQNLAEYLKAAGKQAMFGKLSNETNELGTSGEVALAFFNLDLPKDCTDLGVDIGNIINDIKAVFKHNGKVKILTHLKETGIDLIGFLPVFGTLKYTDEAGAILKGTTKELKGVAKYSIKLDNLSDDISKWMGKDIKTINNGDEVVILAKDEKRRIRVDLKNMDVNAKPNVYVEENVNGKWKNRNEAMQVGKRPISSKINIFDGLKNIEDFDTNTLEHLFIGEVRKGKALGFHYTGISEAKGKIIKGTELPKNEFGAYQAKVEIDGIPKTTFEGYSTFFPDEMSPQQIVDSINQAYLSKVKIDEGIYVGLSKNGMKINLFINQEGKIITAYPVYP